jgi:uncharacterized protein
MSLFDKINEDIKKAMLAREKEKLESLRAIKAALLLARTEKGAAEEMSSDAELKVLQKLVKQRKESAEIYKTQNRPDLYEREVAEASVIETYLPAPLSEEEILQVIKAAIEQLGAKTAADMGKVMGLVTKQLAGKADGRVISAKVKELLG